jgi:hypothetical protein
MTVRIGTLCTTLAIARRGASASQLEEDCPTARESYVPAVNSLSLLAPVFLAFEIWQLVMSERYVGIKQIARAADPREMGPSEVVSCFWSSCIVLYGLWAVALMATPTVRIYALVLIGVTAVGYSIRRNCGLKWILVVLTFEGAIRVAVLAPLSVVVWKHL